MTIEPIINKYGVESSRVRHANVLPLGWEIPSDKQIDRIMIILTRIADCRRRKPKELTIEAAILVMLILQTGRSNDELLELQFFRKFDAKSEIKSPGLYSFKKNSGLYSSKKRKYIAIKSQSEKPIEGCNLQSLFIILPQAPLLKRLMKKLAIAKQQNICIFQSNKKDIIKAAKKICAGGPDWKTETTKATRGLNAMRRWFRHRFRQTSNDDPAFLSILSPSLSSPEKILSTYVCVDASKLWAVYYKSFSATFKRLERQPPEWLEGLFNGSNSCPDNAAMKKAIESLKRMLKRPMFAPRLTDNPTEDNLGPTTISSKHHFAMMLYTYVFATFGTGQRSSGYICDIAQVDIRSGFAWVKEKQNLKINMSGDRGVYHAPEICQQLEFYENYLDTVTKHLSRVDPKLSSDLKVLRAEDGLTFFDIINNKIVKISPFELCKKNKNIVGWPFGKNAGRHWLRSQLAGEVPGDALAAQFGHLTSGFDVWSQYSGLQPSLVAKALSKPISSLLHQAGLDPIGNKRKSHVSNVYKAPDFVNSLKTPNERAGQLLASAIWNGAMLQQSFEENLLTEFDKRGIIYTDDHWIELEETDMGSAVRWKIDSTTLALLRQYRDFSTNLCRDPELLLKDFLKTEECVATFREAAERKWRLRLPPILYEKVIGNLDNLSLPIDRFKSGSKRVIYTKKGSMRAEKAEIRQTAIDLQRYLRKLYKDSKDLHKEAGKSIYRILWKQKRWVYDQAKEGIGNQAFFKGMTTLEQSISSRLIDQLQSYRRKLDIRGYAVSTINDRVKRIWLNFVPTGPKQDWEDTSIEDMDLEFISSKTSGSKLNQKAVIYDIKIILEPTKNTSNCNEEIDNLSNSPYNRTVETLRHDEYDKLCRNSEIDKNDKQCDNSEINDNDLTIYALCYRTGIRTSELNSIKKMDLKRLSNGNIYLILNHDPYNRLKTFYSRRKIPLDLFLNEKELEKFENLVKNSELDYNKVLDMGVKKYQKDQNYRTHLKSAFDWECTTLYPLRHAFASNTLLALLWPINDQPGSHHLIDPLSMARRFQIRDRLVGEHSLGAAGPHATALVMGHTNPYRALYNYAHNLELAIAKYVDIENS